MSKSLTKLHSLIHGHFTNGNDKYLRHLSVDCIIFGFHEDVLKVLLLHSKFSNQWAMPGGFIEKTEHLDEAAKRVLAERTGIRDLFLQQFYIFSDPQRSNRKFYEQYLKAIGLPIKDSWMFERFVSVGYTALLDYTKVTPVSDAFSYDCTWHPVNHLPSLMMDHQNMLNKALQHLRLTLNHQPIGYNLLPAKFTMPELQKLYEVILGRRLDRRNFQRKIMSTGILKKLEERRKAVAHKAPNLYKFDVKHYNKALESGMGFQLK